MYYKSTHHAWQLYSQFSTFLAKMRNIALIYIFAFSTTVILVANSSSLEDIEVSDGKAQMKQEDRGGGEAHDYLIKVGNELEPAVRKEEPRKHLGSKVEPSVRKEEPRKQPGTMKPEAGRKEGE